MKKRAILQRSRLVLYSMQKHQPSSSIRLERIQSDISRVLSSKLLELSRDKYISPVSLSAIRLSRDLSHADVYLLPLTTTDTSVAQQQLQQLSRFENRLRRQLALGLALQRVPKLKMRLDSLALEQQRVAQTMAAERL